MRIKSFQRFDAACPEKVDDFRSILAAGPSFATALFHGN